MTLRLNGSTSGYVEIDAPAVAGSNTLVLPTGNGTSGQVLSTNGSGALSFVDRMTAAGPAFSAYMSAGATISAFTFVKVAANTEEYDTASCYDAVNYRFTPNVAGYYQFNGVARAIASTTSRSIIMFYKNGTSRGRLYDLTYNRGGTDCLMNGSDLIYLNGSTDYVELFVYFDATGALTLGSAAASATCYFQGFLARPA